MWGPQVWPSCISSRPHLLLLLLVQSTPTGHATLTCPWRAASTPKPHTLGIPSTCQIGEIKTKGAHWTGWLCPPPPPHTDPFCLAWAASSGSPSHSAGPPGYRSRAKSGQSVRSIPYWPASQLASSLAPVGALWLPSGWAGQPSPASTNWQSEQEETGPPTQWPS